MSSEVVNTVYMFVVSLLTLVSVFRNCEHFEIST